MNKYPGWLNALVLIIFLTGLLLSLPNIYGTTPAVQLSGMDGVDLSEARLEQVVQSIENAGITPEAAYLKDGRIVLRFDSVAEQRNAEERLRSRYEREVSIALTLAPKLPEWIRGIGLDQMSLGLDLRGGVYVLLEVDMDTAVGSRMATYQQDLTTGFGMREFVTGLI